MNRQQLRITDEDLVAEFGRIVDLFSRALGKRSDAAAAYRRVNEAAAQGLTWVEALERAADATKVRG